MSLAKNSFPSKALDLIDSDAFRQEYGRLATKVFAHLKLRNSDNREVRAKRPHKHREIAENSLEGVNSVKKPGTFIAGGKSKPT